MNPKTSTPPLSDAEAVWQQLQQRNARLAAMAVLVAARRHRLKQAWSNMNTRCFYPKASNFQWYGARGITVCQEWRGSFAVFARWALANGFYTDLTLDRKANDGNYTPENCRWVTMGENNKNRQVTPKFMAAVFVKWEKNKAKMWSAARAARSRPIIASDGVIYPSTAAASRAIGRNKTAISRCLQTPGKTAGGLTWRYVNSAYLQGNNPFPLA